MVAELGLRQEEDTMTIREAAVVSNGTDYNNCNVSTTATPTTGFRYRIYHFSRHRPTTHPYVLLQLITLWT